MNLIELSKNIIPFPNHINDKLNNTIFYLVNENELDSIKKPSFLEEAVRNFFGLDKGNYGLDEKGLMVGINNQPENYSALFNFYETSKGYKLVLMKAKAERKYFIENFK